MNKSGVKSHLYVFSCLGSVVYALIVQMYASIHLEKDVVSGVYSIMPKLYCVGNSRWSS